MYLAVCLFLFFKMIIWLMDHGHLQDKSDMLPYDGNDVGNVHHPCYREYLQSQSIVCQRIKED